MTGKAQSLADGAVGLALLHLTTGNLPATKTALRAATAQGVSTGDGASLFYGAPALAYVLAITDHPALARARSIAAEGTATVLQRRLDAAHHRIDQHQQPDYAEYDLIRGLTGLGVVLRQLGDQQRLRHVLDYLVRLTEPLDTLPGWWCANPPERHQPADGGHGNFGIAHGITGPLALLALTHRDGTTVAGHTTAITRICQWLDYWRQTTDHTTWWPQTITLDDLSTDRPAQTEPLRPSWCYGTPGIARTQQLAAIALHDTDRQHRSEAAFTACLTDPTQTRRLTDRSLCHGTAGLLATARRIATDTTSVIPLERAQEIHQQAALPNEAGLLDGPLGASLLDAAPAARWDACLLIT